MKAVHYCLLPVMLMFTFAFVNSQLPAFLADPVSIAAIDGTMVEFSCTAENVEEVLYRVNGTPASDPDIQRKGFTELGGITVSAGTVKRSLKVAVSLQYNNTEIFCRGIGEHMNVNSKTAYLTVQGPLSIVAGLSPSFISVNILGTPPFTLPDNKITITNSVDVQQPASSHNFKSYLVSLTFMSISKTVSGITLKASRSNNIVAVSSSLQVQQLLPSHSSFQLNTLSCTFSSKTGITSKSSLTNSEVTSVTTKITADPSCLCSPIMCINTASGLSSSAFAGILVAITVPVTTVLTAFLTTFFICICFRQKMKEIRTFPDTAQPYESPFTIRNREFELKGNEAYDQTINTSSTPIYQYI